MGSKLWLLTMILLRKPGPTFGGACLQKNSGAAEGRSTAPYSTRPGWGARGRPGPGRISGDGLLHPSPGFAPTTGATIAGGTPRTCVFGARIQAGATINRVPAEPRGTGCS